MGQPAKVNWGLGYRGAESTKEVKQKGLSHFVKGAHQKVEPKKLVMKYVGTQEVLKHGCAAGTRKETDRFISNCVRPSKKQHRMFCWFCGKVGHKKVECFAHEKSINMAKKVNKMFIKPMRAEEVSLAKIGLLDEVKEETSEEGCSSVKSDLEDDQEASSLEPRHEVVCGTKGKEIERALSADGEGLMVKKTTHEGSQVLNISWSKGSSTENAYLIGEKSMCGAHLVGEKSTFGVKVSRSCGVKVLSWSCVDLESKRVTWRYGKRNKLEEQVYDLKEE
ncbi:hypothetical protein F2Q69_00044316 [Brassica cretica]|uniref:CCHC-type domain-containing protein n=1 Tax=Brassica cretica TaxID=69181 RepID=A0A8S9NM40_BRACR|nr:hypothetical protein F2Q69_00044316 [Brassica cretica]